MVKALVTLGGLFKSRVTLVEAKRQFPWISLNRNKTTMAIKSQTYDAIEGLEPSEVFQMFGKLSSLPRPSFHEDRVIEWLKEFADERQLEWKQDGAGNMVICHPGTMEGSQAPPVIIQGHIDMVTEKNDTVEHDFFKDPIKLIRDGDWLKADGTTLGADNGVGVACALAVIDTPKDSKDILLPPIEALFTVAEETGLVGAFNLDGNMLRGKTLLNLDTEDWPDIFIGCAGGGDSLLTLPLHVESTPGESYTIMISGLSGGHSGMDIDKYRGNAVKIAAELSDRLLARGISIAEIQGGDKRNALARESVIRIVLNESETSKLKEDLSIWQTELPHGVVKMSPEMEGLVETSNNVASIKMAKEGGHIVATIQCATRSSIGSALERIRRSIRCVGESFGARVEQKAAYPGWQPQPDSAIVRLCKEAIEESSGEKTALMAIHAGLECGILGERIKGVQCVSYGPTIRGAHSPDERLQISTVKPFWSATLLLLEKLAKLNN